MIGSLLDKRYRVITLLQKGIFGETYLAADIRRWGRQCIVKRLQPDSSNLETLQVVESLFNSEARTLENLGREHDQIPDLIDFFKEQQEFYLVQEFVKGSSLREILNKAQKLTESEVISFLKDVLKVLNFVHHRQIIHRDIKPSNLIKREQDGKIVLIDFGAVKQVKTQIFNPQGKTVLSHIVGTNGYMPNEQLGGKPRFSSDIYALGMTAIEALTGVSPSKLSEDPQTGEIIWRDRTQVSQRLAAILDKMVRSHFSDRYQSTTEVLNDLSKLDRAPLQPAKKVMIGCATLVLGLTGLATTKNSLFAQIQPHNFNQQVAANNNFEAAIPDTHQAVGLNFNYAEAYDKLDNAFDNLENYQVGLENYTPTIQIQPNFTNPYYHLDLPNPQPVRIIKISHLINNPEKQTITKIESTKLEFSNNQGKKCLTNSKFEKS